MTVFGYSPMTSTFINITNGIHHSVTGAKVENLPPWAIPNFGKEVYRFEVMPVKPWNDSDQLFQRGDVYGFIGILAALRHAVITDEPELVHHHCANAHSALASLGRNDTFRPFWARLSIALFRLQKYLGQTDIVPCLSKIREQIDADQYLRSGPRI